MSDHINGKGMSLEVNGYNFRFRGITFTTRTLLLLLAKCNKKIHLKSFQVFLENIYCHGCNQEYLVVTIV